MVNWVHHGAVSDAHSDWMTNAEYVDGKAYFYPRNGNDLKASNPSYAPL